MEGIELPKQEEKFPSEYDPTNENSDISKLYKLMKEQKLEEADAVIWLEGNVEDRVAKCAKLMQSNYARELVVSGGAQRGGDLPIENIEKDFLSAGISQGRIIMETESRNTKDQAERIVRMAAEKNWKKIILVVNPYYEFRAFLTFLAELKKEKKDQEIEIINAPVDLSWFSIPSGDRKEDEVDLLEHEEIPRLIKYSKEGDVARPEEGIEYLEYWKNKEVNS